MPILIFLSEDDGTQLLHEFLLLYAGGDDYRIRLRFVLTILVAVSEGYSGPSGEYNRSLYTYLWAASLHLFYGVAQGELIIGSCFKFHVR